MKPLTDPLADMLTRLRNALAVRQATVRMPYSGHKAKVLEVLVQEGWINSINVIDNDKFKELEVKLFDDNQNSRITALRRVSKPGRRVYVNAATIPRVRGGHGSAILSTSKGVLSAQAARKERVGGEVICLVW